MTGTEQSMCARWITNLNGAENPENQRLNDDKSSRADAKGEVDSDVLAHL